MTMPVNIITLSCAAALASSAAWACGSILWKKIGEQIPPESMNLCRGIIGCTYLTVPLMFTRLDHLEWTTVMLLALSGFIGITLGDTFFFRALVNLGPRQTSLFGTLTPGFTALAALSFLNEYPSPLAWTGIGLTITGVFWVLKERPASGAPTGDKRLGLLYCALSAGSTIIAVLLARIALPSIPSMEATFLRLFFGTLGMFIWGAGTGRLDGWLVPFKNAQLFKKVALVVAVAVFGGFWLSLFALKHLPTAIASTLGSTAALFILPLSAFWLKEKITTRACLGAAVAVGGVTLIFFGK
ncbi:MAG: DMT family transporter [Candidatus Omnitrophota bacterium]